MHHQQCSGLPEDVFSILLSTVALSGWVCCKCKLDFDGVEVNLAKVNKNGRYTHISGTVSYTHLTLPTILRV